MTAALMLSIFIPGKPIAFARAGSNGTRRYTPEPQASYAAVVGTIARCAMAKAGYKPFDGPVEVFYRATFAWPASWSQKRRDRITIKTSKPDVDNLFKVAADALSGIAFLDDAQIGSLTAQKRYGPVEGVTMTITPIGEVGDA